MDLTDEEFIRIMDRLYTSDDPRVDEAFDHLRSYLGLVLTEPYSSRVEGPFEKMRKEVDDLHFKIGGLYRKILILEQELIDRAATKMQDLNHESAMTAVEYYSKRQRGMI